jgi:glutathione S-transferase
MFDGKYILWGAEYSLFTRKLQAQLSYQRLDYDFKLKCQEQATRVEARLGTHFIPGLQTPEGWFLHDTTPIGLMLNAKYPNRSILPASPVQRIASHLLEDWADEWFGRYAIHSRWCYPDNVEAIAPHFFANLSGKFLTEQLSEEEHAKALELIPLMRDGFGLRACENRGCGPDQTNALRRDFDQLMQHADTHFESHWLDDDTLPTTLTPIFEHMLNGPIAGDLTKLLGTKPEYARFYHQALAGQHPYLTIEK